MKGARKTMEIFGKCIAPGPVVYDDGRARIDAVVEKIEAGYQVSGTIRGRAGRIEILRGSAPAEFLMNNWQSWGPTQKMAAGQTLAGLEERMANYSRYVFTPIPDAFLAHLVSDYFVAWDGGLAGFLTSQTAHPYFEIEAGGLAGCLEYFGTTFDDPVPLEPLIILEGAPVERLLESYAARVAARNNVRINRRNPVGWSSWYHYFTSLQLADIEKNIRIARKKFPFEVFQIDDGFEADIGDWRKTKAGFGSLADLAHLIRHNGYEAGIWTAPFSAAETSELFQQHPDWMVSDAGRPKFCYKNWHRNIYALDVTNPEVKNWLFETFVELKKTGFNYFKIDFLFAAAMEGTRSQRVSPIQAYREGLEIIRRSVGDSFILGCGAPLLPAIGFVDGMRIGEDTAPFWNSAMTAIQGPNAYRALKNCFFRSFMHKKWWLNDPDCLLLRKERIELKAHERELYARSAGALDNMIIESDDLELVDEWGRALLDEAIRLREGHVRVHGLLADDLYVIESRDGSSGSFRYAANLADKVQQVENREIAPRSGAFLTA
jgi:alpha-galactosidase